MSDQCHFVKCNSHRARTKMLKIVGEMHGYYSFRRETGKGVYLLTLEQYIQVKDITGITRIRGPYDDLMKCWS